VGVARAITEPAVDALVAGVFSKPDPLVLQAYSVPDEEPIVFTTQRELAEYMKFEVSKPLGLAYISLVYPDMGGFAVKETIGLNPKHCPGQTLRYTWQGWGLISVQLHGSAHFQMSRVAANSAARAQAWASTYPQLGSPDRWNWEAVARHTRRLNRILRKVT
jgi:hypothetical protein